MGKKLVLKAVILLAITVPIISIITLAFENNPYFAWSSGSVAIGSTAYGAESIEVCPDNVGPIPVPTTAVNFAVVTNYSINGVVMPKLQITGEIGGIPPVNVVAANWGNVKVWAAAYYSIWFITSPETIGYYIAQPIPSNTNLIGQVDYGAAGAINLNITPWWARSVSVGSGYSYSYQTLSIT
ncbi:hypothetical protein YG5714_1181 [Sulfolobus islandicus Y.G.57.14]|uniref:Uncharacterized protein n=1 Tax=Saccharolobus islandicus (strain Y.G.57.14 / Yellowstone \|nr:hypothetical protein [Sulfolobus islandicus]ACP45449.1 hypothetical protein YG5714_1181 [Sulfolobus islandicus Y.G.57.14]